MHSILQRQLTKYFGQSQGLPQNPTAWSGFLEAISKTYDDFDEDHRLIEHSLELSSKELNQQNKELLEKTTQLAQKIHENQIEKVRDRAILAFMGEGLISTDAVGTIQIVNKMAETILGYSEQELLHTNIFSFYERYGNIERISYEPMHIQLQSGKRVQESLEFQRKDGTRFVMDINASPIIQDGKTISIINIIRDVTVEKEIDHIKTEFISIASHQLRTPLSAIKWFIEMLIEGDAGKLTEQQGDFAKNIHDSTERMIQLVDSLLNISRIESGRLMIKPMPVDLKELIQDVIKDLKVKVEEKQQHIATSVHEGLPKINLDPKLIRQVYLNILSNAVKYTQKGGDIQILVSIKDDQLISQISDNGYGIPEYQQDRLFQKFFRADNTSKTETEGTGLGLYLTKAIIMLANGKIWFKSEEGKGTTFWFSLPLSGMKPKAGEVTFDSKVYTADSV